MARLGKLPVAVPDKVQVNIANNNIVIKGPKGELTTHFTPDVVVTFEGGQVLVKPANDSKRSRSMWGTVRANVNNLVKGVTEGFTKTMEINGVGYRAAVTNATIGGKSRPMLTMTLGFSHEIRFMVPEGIEIKATKPTELVISGADRQQVGQVAAELRRLRKPEPYKGKGVKYAGEQLRRKEGKKK